MCDNGYINYESGNCSQPIEISIPFEQTINIANRRNHISAYSGCNMHQESSKGDIAYHAYLELNEQLSIQASSETTAFSIALINDCTQQAVCLSAADSKINQSDFSNYIDMTYTSSGNRDVFVIIEGGFPTGHDKYINLSIAKNIVDGDFDLGVDMDNDKENDTDDISEIDKYELDKHESIERDAETEPDSEFELDYENQDMDKETDVDLDTDNTEIPEQNNSAEIDLMNIESPETREHYDNLTDSESNRGCKNTDNTCNILVFLIALYFLFTRAKEQSYKNIPE